LTYQIIVNWAAAEHKTQGLFQAQGCRHQIERFWELAPGAHGARELFSEIREPIRFAA
jgi:hypothetical protein